MNLGAVLRRAERIRDWPPATKLVDRALGRSPELTTHPRVAGRRLPVQRVTRRLRVVPEPVEVTARAIDLDKSVEFIADRLRRRHHGPVGDDVRSEVARTPWYHTIELPGGIVTDGAFDHRDLVRWYGIPADLSGRRVLDVATADGFWAYEFERRGAEVTAVDIDSTDDVDLPLPARRRAVADGTTDTLSDGFALAHRLLDSSVVRTSGSVYDLDPERLGTFDLVHCGDLLLHLRDPNLALQRIRMVTGERALLSDVFDPSLGDDNGLIRYMGGRATAGWWLPSLPTLVQMVSDAGFSIVEVVRLYQLDVNSEGPGPWRAVLEARP